MKSVCVFIVSSFREPNVDAIIPLLEQRQVRWFRFNTETFPLLSQIQVCCDANEYYSTISHDDRKIDTREVTSVWNRSVGGFLLSDGLTAYEQNFARTECMALVGSMYASLRCSWINPVYGEHLSGPKPYQLDVARSVGLSVPRTLVTNDPTAAEKFTQSNTKTLFKVVSGVSHITEPPNSKQLQSTYAGKFPLAAAPAIQSHRSNKLPFATILTPERLEKITKIIGCPVVFQQYTEKHVELRITIVGDLIFAAEIHSQEFEETKIDFRHMTFAEGHRTVPTHKVHALPDEISDKLLSLMKQLDLVFGCVDMILTPEGEYVFLEVNPSGQWDWIEKLTGLKITEALVDILVDPPTTL